MTDEILLKVIRAKMAATRTLYKTAAKDCHVSRSMFSQYVNGEIPIPDNIKTRFIKILRLEKFLKIYDCNDKVFAKDIIEQLFKDII